MKSNPFYALSASAMLLGCYLLGEALQLEAGKLRSLLLLMAVLQLYELLLVGLGAFLVRSGRAPDGVVVLVLASAFLMNATGLSAECVAADRTTGTLVTLALAALAALKLWWVRRRVPGVLSSRAAGALLAFAVFALATPVVAAGQASARRMDALALYGMWWAAAALPLWRRALREATLAHAREAPRAHNAWTWMPCVILLYHLWSVGYVHTLDFHAAYLAPFLLSLALAARPEQQRVKLAAPALAVLLSLGADTSLYVPLPGSDEMLSPQRLALVGLGLVWLYLGWRDREPWLAALPIAGAALYLLGPHAARALRAVLRALADGLPRDRFGWGALTVLAAFVLLAAGVRRSLHGDPRWPRLASPRDRKEAGHVR